MNDKSTLSLDYPQHPVAGINRNDTDIEFFGIKKNQTVQFLQGGQVFYFDDLAPKYFVMLLNKLNADQGAKEYFADKGYSTKRKVELYTYLLYGSLDHVADIIDGVLQPSENFRHIENCPSLTFDEKQISIDGKRLSLRELTIIDMSARECTDYEIADALHISLPTLDFHKKKLFVKTGTQTKLGFVMKAFQNDIIE